MFIKGEGSQAQLSVWGIQQRQTAQKLLPWGADVLGGRGQALHTHVCAHTRSCTHMLMRVSEEEAQR